LSKRDYGICLMRGDGIGPEIVEAAILVLNSVSEKYKFTLHYDEVAAGDRALREVGDPLPPSSVRAFEESDACLKGPVGETVNEINRRLRFAFDLYANLRPAKSYPSICPPALRPDIDIIVIRENSEGFYRALENEIAPGVWSSMGVFTEKGATRIAKFAFDYARERGKRGLGKGKLALATKSNIFRNSHGMYLKTFEKMSSSY
jgi:3-isopropylmalate dehydrogenase